MTLTTGKIKNLSRIKVFYIIGWGKCSEDPFCSCCKCSLLSRNASLLYFSILRCLVLLTFARLSLLQESARISSLVRHSMRKCLCTGANRTSQCFELLSFSVVDLCADAIDD